MKRLTFGDLKPRSRPRYKQRRRAVCRYCARRQYAQYGKAGTNQRLRERVCAHCGVDPKHTGSWVLRTVDWTTWKRLGDEEIVRGAAMRAAVRRAGIGH